MLYYYPPSPTPPGPHSPLPLLGLLREKWEVLLGIRLLGNTFWFGLSNHQAAAAQTRLVETNIVECRPP